MIATAYKLPFQFEHSEVGVLSGRPVSIQVRTERPDATGPVYEAMRLFTRIAAVGAFGSRQLAPCDTEFVAAALHSEGGCETLTRASPCSVAPEAWIVLCHLLLAVHRTHPITSVKVVVDGDSSPVALMHAAESTYPLAFGPLPFMLDDTEPEGGGYSFFIALESALTPENEAALNDWLDAWVQVVGHGGYGLAPIDPATDYVEPYGDGVEAYDNFVEWAVFKLRADPVAAMDALLNLLSCFHTRCQRIRSVEIG